MPCPFCFLRCKSPSWHLCLDWLGSYSSFKTPVIFYFMWEAFPDSPRLGEGKFFIAPLSIAALTTGFYNCLLEYFSNRSGDSADVIVICVSSSSG